MEPYWHPIKRGDVTPVHAFSIVEVAPGSRALCDYLVRDDDTVLPVTRGPYVLKDGCRECLMVVQRRR